MNIKTQIITTAAQAVALIGLIGVIAVYSQMTWTRSAALTEATNVAQQLAGTITFKASDDPHSLFERPNALREFLTSQHVRSHRDFVVVDRQKVVLADIAGEEHNIGGQFTHDLGNEIASTMEDGRPRDFTEVSPEEPQGVEFVVVPVEEAEGKIIGAVLLETTPILLEAQQRTNGLVWLIGLCTAAAALTAGIFAFFLTRGFNTGLTGLTQGIQSLAQGDVGARIGNISENEFGRLAQGLNAMAGELETSRAQLLDQKSYIEDIVQTVAEGIAVIDNEGRVASVNPAASEIFGRRHDKIEGQEWQSVIDMQSVAGDKLAPGNSPIELALVTSRPYQREVSVLRPDGSRRLVVASCSPLNRPDGGVVLSLNDVSELRRAERTVNQRAEELAILNLELRQNSEATGRLVKLGELLQACVTFREAFDVVGSAMPDFFKDLSGTVHLTSASRNLVEEMAHWGDVRSSAAQFGPEDCWALRRGQEHISGPGLLSPRCSHINDGGTGGYVCVPLAAQGETLGILHLCEPQAAAKPQWLSDWHQILRGVADTLALALANLRLRETLRQQSIRDPNTGLFNRRYIEETGNRELRRMQRAEQPFAMIMLDVDHFKQFNDTFGHEAGDLVLKHVASVLLDHARETDVASRYGGEEFALILPGVSLASGAERAESLRQAIRQIHLVHRGHTLGTVTASFGVAAYPDNGVQWADIVNTADRALYQAKNEGRDRVVAGQSNPAQATAV
ncbi:diguanylate cyclase [Phyllobacterium brassicacearum]|nr:diguanylate cyclase [Phyllobacterium brassicacearum]TDQ12223.1 PAS domain S-box-containing protein/diguanylate cyclase (GGDEF)-like protein [Phyllobacterium brassicacearum]